MDEDLKAVLESLPDAAKLMIQNGKALEFFVMLAVNLGKSEGKSDSQILDRIHKEALSSLIACT